MEIEFIKKTTASTLIISFWKKLVAEGFLSVEDEKKIPKIQYFSDSSRKLRLPYDNDFVAEHMYYYLFFRFPSQFVELEKVLLQTFSSQELENYRNDIVSYFKES